ncbi:MAG: GNAT family N-acetyltransferase [Candidatus Omnitrophica bacterium]|nr:GNAT family N-acetyltransferase [Candidatus Omnitrophota bacterium]
MPPCPEKPKLHFRSAGPGDSARILRWSNEPSTRRASFSSHQITEEEHAQWFKKRLADEDSRLYVAESAQGQHVGLVRFVRSAPEHAEVGIVLDPAFRGKGLGGPLLQGGIERMRADWGPLEILADIKPENAGSLRLFEKAGFVRVGESEYAGQPCVRYVLSP